MLFVTADGFVHIHNQVFKDKPKMHRIHRIIPGEHSNCLLIGETLHIGKGVVYFLCMYNVQNEFALNVFNIQI